MSFSPKSYLDANGLPWECTPYGDLIVGTRHDSVSVNFTYGLPSQITARIELYDKSGGAGTFTVNETVSGGTSGATAIIETIVTPIRLRVIRGVLTDGETITGVGITAAESGATCVITKNVAVNGTVSTASSVCLLTSGTFATCRVALESKQYSSYNVGHEMGAFFSAAFDAAGVSAASTQYIGLSTRGGSDGYFVGYEGTAFGFLVRKGGVTVSHIAQTAWNIDKLNGLGPSRLDMSAMAPNINTFHIKKGSGGYGAILSVIGTNGRLYPVHFYTLINAGTATAVADPHFIVRAEITKTSGATTPQIRTTAWNAYYIGPNHYEMAPQRNSGFIAPAVSVTTGAERYICTITNKLTFAGVANNTPMRITSMSLGIDANATNGSVIRFRRNTPVTGTTQTDVNLLNSSCSTSTSGTAGFTGGEVIFTSQGGYGGGTHTVSTNGHCWIMPGESLTITSESTSTQISRIGVHWEEGL
jgi:hypothetical protein